MPVLYITIVLDSFYLLIFYSEKFSTWIWHLPFGVNVNIISLITEKWLSADCLQKFLSYMYFRFYAEKERQAKNQLTHLLLEILLKNAFWS